MNHLHLHETATGGEAVRAFVPNPPAASSVAAGSCQLLGQCICGTGKTHQAEYYRLLSAIRTEGDWESWVCFFLDCTTEAAENAQRSIIDIASLIAADRKKVMVAKDGTVQAIRLFEMLPTMPRFTTTFAAESWT